jgi:hypothetical protein
MQTQGFFLVEQNHKYVALSGVFKVVEATSIIGAVRQTR